MHKKVNLLNIKVILLSVKVILLNFSPNKQHKLRLIRLSITVNTIIDNSTLDHGKLALFKLQTHLLLYNKDSKAF